LENLAEHDQALAERLGRRSIAFDDLAEFDDCMLVSVFRSAEPEVVQASLLGAPSRLIERILHQMPPDEATRLRKKLDCPGPIRLSDVEEARRRIAALAQCTLHGKPSRAAA
jgi:flagellar motor switch protein FliG